MIKLWDTLKGDGGAGGGSGKLPTIVTDSGSSLPLTSGYQLNDTFLNTSDKKIYQAEADGYVKNTDTTITCTIDYYTGIAKNFGAGSYGTNYYAHRSSLPVWRYSDDIVDYTVKFKVTSLAETPIFSFYGSNYPSFSSYYVCFGIGSDNKIYQTYYSYSTGSYTKRSQAKILDTEIVANTVYILNLRKQGSSCIAQLTLENGTVLEEKTFEVTSFAGNTINYGMGYVETSLKYSGNLEVYLLQSSGELLVPNPDLSWDSGTDLTEGQYADKTNGILYLYENDELVNIPQKNTLSFTNVSASSWVSDSTYADYGYKCELSCSGVTSSMYAMVNFAPTEADSGNYATVCLTGTDTVTIYSKVNDTITIPSIVVMGV